MSGPKISLHMIVKDEEENLGQCLSSIRPHVDSLTVVDTGSADKTRDVARSFGATVIDFTPQTHPDAFFVDDEATCSAFTAPGPFSGKTALGNFDVARQVSWDAGALDYQLWIDADDVVSNPEKLREVVAAMERDRVTQGFLAYDYAHDHLGRVLWRQWRERIVKRGCGRWIQPVHEVLLPIGPAPLMARYNQAHIVHRRRAGRVGIERRNYKLLLRQYTADRAAGREVDPRTLFYLGNEARFCQPERALGFYKEYVEKSGWAEERSDAHIKMGGYYELLKDWPAADREYAMAAHHFPHNPDGLFGSARVAYYRQRWQDCVDFSERGLALKNPESMLGCNPLERTYRPFLFAHVALNKLGRVEDALAACIAGLQACPDDPGCDIDGASPGQLEHSKRAYEQHLAEKKAGQPVHAFSDLNPDSPVAELPIGARLVFALQMAKEAAVVDRGAGVALVDALPGRLRDAPEVRRLRARLASPRLQVVIYTGPCVDTWGPTTAAEHGLGGSETAAAEMAKRLAARGMDVHMYGEHEGHEGVHDGVTYRHHTAPGGGYGVDYERLASECDVFVSSRQPWILDDRNPRVRAKLKLLWVHDIHCGPATPDMERWLLRFDRVLCLSAWHRDFVLRHYPTLAPEQVLQTRNGIDLARFKVVPATDDLVRGIPPVDYDRLKRNRMVFSSSPNRGLDRLIELLPQIRARVPDAELHVFYGFETWEKVARAHGAPPQALEEIAGWRRRLVESPPPGLVFRGRVSQRELARAFLEAKVWAYPTSFEETSCISAMEAQAAGCIPVTSRLAALAETVRVGVLKDPPASSAEYGAWFVETCAHLMQSEKTRSGIAAAARSEASTFSWDAVADEWTAVLPGLIAEVRRHPAPAWRAA